VPPTAPSAVAKPYGPAAPAEERHCSSRCITQQLMHDATSPSPAAGTSPQALVAAGVSAPSKLEGFTGGSACRTGAMGKRDYGVETSTLTKFNMEKHPCSTGKF
jgi:hypothetical protein